jgi:hypothetical protein
MHIPQSCSVTSYGATLCGVMFDPVYDLLFSNRLHQLVTLEARLYLERWKGYSQ